MLGMEKVILRPITLRVFANSISCFINNFWWFPVFLLFTYWKEINSEKKVMCF